jgi:alpha-D-ribose 1-methylphosphonate 5-triphosphate diphosphatase PhnM
MTDDRLLLANARLVLADEVIGGGWLVAVNGVISEFGRGRPPARAEDMAGDLVIPGLVERADLVRIRLTERVPVVRSVWRMGRRVA